MSKKVKEIIVDRIKKLVESNNCLPWESPFFNVVPRNYRGTKYHGVNRLLLSYDNETHYLTFNQIKKHGGKLKKGSKHRMVVYSNNKTVRKWIDRDEKDKYYNFEIIDEDADEDRIKIEFSYSVLRYFRVYRQKDVENIDHKEPEQANNNFEDVNDIEKFIENTGAKIENHTGTPCYMHQSDKIKIPAKKLAKSETDYYSTMFHELSHWTGHESRLNRLNGNFSEKGKDYSFEELIAEISSSMLAKHFKIDKEIEKSADYVKSWLQKLENNTDWIVKAGSKAEKAYNFLMSLQPR
jgi:antirestriction protein ArdC